MNLKQAFRYQSYLNGLLDDVVSRLLIREDAFDVLKRHEKNAANPEAEDVDQFVPHRDGYIDLDTVVEFAVHIVNEREKLTTAICLAKEQAYHTYGIYLDAALESNKFRQQVTQGINNLLKAKDHESTEAGRGYKFSNEGVQTPYYYDIVVSYTTNYNRDKAKDISKELSTESEDVSSKIDSIMISVEVPYKAEFDVNDSPEDSILAFAEAS